MFSKLKYKDFGVDIDAGNEFVSELKSMVKKTYSPSVVGGLGGFSGLFKFPSGIKEPVLCAATDGVGSKIKLAIQGDKLETLGIDLVAMCVNDLICDFATPLFFLDYYATGKLVKQDALRVVSGIVDGCKIAGCSLIGGESAELPSMYRDGDFDMVGFSVGVAERGDFSKRENICNGDVVLALPSSGFHSNGFSLLAGIATSGKVDLSSQYGSSTLLEELLTPTRIYVKEFLEYKGHIKALAHITGGGIAENLVRVLPDNTEARVFKSIVLTPEIFNIFTEFVEEEEAWRVFNMGVGMILITDKASSDYLMSKIDAYQIGFINHSDRKAGYLED